MNSFPKHGPEKRMDRTSPRINSTETASTNGFGGMG